MLKIFVPIALLVLLLGFYYYDKNAEVQNDGAQIDAVTSHSGIELGITELELILKRGNPDNLVDQDARKIYSYVYSQALVFYLYDVAGTYILKTICDTKPQNTPLSINEEDSESDIITKLGSNYQESIDINGFDKLLFYPEYNVVYFLRENKLHTYCVTSKNNFGFKEENTEGDE